MKNRYVPAILAVLMLLTALFLPREKASSSRVVHQHRSWPAESELTDGFRPDGTLCSHLPLIILHTDGRPIPGAERTDLAELSCDYEIICSPDGINASDAPARSRGHALLSVRGRTSRELPKKQYSLKLVDEEGLPRNEALLGMPAESVWVLNGSFIDRSMIRNYMLYNLSGEIMDYAPRTRLCEVLITDSTGHTVYQGVYTLIEKPKVSESRLDLHPYDPKYVQTSWLMQMNSIHNPALGVSIEENAISHLLPDDISTTYFGISYPDARVLTGATLEDLQTQILTLDRVLYDSIHTHDWKRVGRYLDLDSAVDYFLINEFFQNYDAGTLSTYFYRNAGGKIHMGPVWDFDGAMNNFFVPVELDELRLQNSFYFNYLSQNKEFTDRCIARYAQLRRSFLSEEYLLRYIDEAAAYLAGPARRNTDRWYPDDPGAFEADINRMKDFVIERGAWMDANFAPLFRISE